MLEEPKRRGALVDLIRLNKEGLIADAKVESGLSCSDCEMVEFRILRGGSKAKSRSTTIDFRE